MIKFLILHCTRADSYLQKTKQKTQRQTLDECLFVCLMVFSATFNNISVISWRSVLLVEETGGSEENHWPVASHWQTLSCNVVHLALLVSMVIWRLSLLSYVQWICLQDTNCWCFPFDFFHYYFCQITRCHYLNLNILL